MMLLDAGTMWLTDNVSSHYVPLNPIPTNTPNQTLPAGYNSPPVIMD